MFPLEQRVEQLERDNRRFSRVLAEFIGQDARRGSRFLRPLLWALHYWRRRALRYGDKGD